MQKVSVLTLLLWLSCCLVFAQTLKQTLLLGDKYFNRKDYTNALAQYVKAYELAPENAETNFKIGIGYLHSQKKTAALQYLEKAYNLNPNIDLDIDFHLGMAYQYHHQYLTASGFYQEYKTKNKKLTRIADHKIAECLIGDSLSHHPAHVRITNSGPAINTPFHEYAPLVPADGMTMIFTSNRTTGQPAKGSINYEDVYLAHFIDSAWSTAERISPNLNHEFHDAAASLAADGKTLFLYYEEGNGDIYVSTNEDGIWTEPIPLNRNINNPHTWETSACISSDGQKLYFTSNRPGGLGELDIYVSERDSTGDWGIAANIGPMINTSGHEDSPYLHANGTTLYFSSDGHPTMGSNDIFQSEWVDGRWTKPVNLGFPINTIDYDGFFIISEDKKTGYFSGLREGGIGNSDIYQVEFLEPPKEDTLLIDTVATESIVAVDSFETFVDAIVTLHKELEIVTILKGKVIDADTGVPLYAKITLVSNETNQILEIVASNPNTGDFELIIPHGGNYGVATESSGYLFNSINFNVPQFAEIQEIDTHIIMSKAEVGSKIVLKNIFFDTGKSELKPESMSELQKINDLLVANTYLKVQINGHTDNTGNPTANKLLSLARAESVVRFLIDKGIEPSRLTAKGFGAEKPLVSNDDETEGRAINRRTEIEITETSKSVATNH